MKVTTLEKQLGIETFASKTQGVGGIIRQTLDDFVVKEVLIDGSKAEFEPPKQEAHLAGEGRYLVCLLVKRGWDTLLAVRKIAKQLGISEQRIRIAGIKDKKAVTVQHISIENINLEKLKKIHINGIHLQPLRHSPNMIFPHMSVGNIFTLTIRGISHSAAMIQERISAIVEELKMLGGVPNFFGHQRFGTVRPITHLVGKALAQDDLEKAALIFLAEPSLYEHPQSRKARQKLSETGDFQEALDYFPRKLLYERLMLSHLAKYPKGYAGAFRRLPKRLCRLFLHAYQSYLFNCFLSHRLLHGIPINEPQIGDYALKTDSHGLPTKSYTKATSKNIENLHDSVRKGEMYVAIPLVGFRQAISEGVQGEIEQLILRREKMTQNSFYISSMPEMSAAGDLRAANTPIQNLGVEKPARDELYPRKRKLRIGFTLHRGCYATVVLREFMKPRSLIKAGF